MENPCLTFVTPTLLAGDRSLTNVVAHGIAHSWTGNLVTCLTWEHFWLNEGFDVFLERKILRRLTGDAIYELHKDVGKVTLWKTVVRIGEGHNFTQLVPNLSGGKDPDDAFSQIPYEKGFYFICYLEALAGGAAAFMPWFKDIWLGGTSRSVTSEDLRRSYSEAFPRAAAKVDWNSWFFTPGFPTLGATASVESQYASALGAASIALARSWRAADEKDLSKLGLPDDIAGWSTNQMVLFLDELSKEKLTLAKCKRLGEVYSLTKSRNCELRLLWYEIAIAAEYREERMAAAAFATEQGRMKFVRPVYRALCKSSSGRQLALDTFAEYRSSYHPICRKMIESDLELV
ncbi:unnamed protein product [Prorocentrum cordatum]|uniref:Peptidase M1 leukotriene A4 hydrolase/aminopeptidase C-terminal domain-containing protein n=1 Tax=Prorocentrum cordatum TaxID=2364126 RepID=A0ABN9VS96_9DINO|nr:unnamed protein product [Polarella glacialis]